MAHSQFYKDIAILRKQGRERESLDRLHEALRRGQLDCEEIERTGSLIRKLWRSDPPSPRPLQVLLLGQFTTSWLADALTAIAWRQRTAIEVVEGEYDNVIQELAAIKPEDGHLVAVLLPWNGRLLAGERTAVERLEAELDFWRQAWGMVSRLGIRLVQAGYDYVGPGPLGYHLGCRRDGPVELVRRANALLREELPAGAMFIDIEAITGAMGRANYYDPRRYFWTKQPFSELGCVYLAEHLWAGIRTLTMGPKKVLVVDLDNTLWGGVVGEVGPQEIALGESPEGEAFLHFQRHLKGLAGIGVVLAVASKNNPPDAREPFEKNPNMLLRLDDIAAFEAGWEPKDVMLRRIAETLNVGLDSFVFFDDQPAEREQIRRALPMVEVVEVPSDPAQFVGALQAQLSFEKLDLTSDDRVRSAQYATERKRLESQRSSATIDEYLGSLNMCGDVRPIDDADLSRVVQLLAKTNQFNLTSRRHTREVVLNLIGQAGAIHLTLRLRDCFGDLGLVSLMIAIPHASDRRAVRIDTWLMSCRVIGRTVEQFLFGELLGACRALGYQQILGEYIPTAKNAPVKNLYLDLGFQAAGDSGEGGSKFIADVQQLPPPKSFVEKKA